MPVKRRTPKARSLSLDIPPIAWLILTDQELPAEEDMTEEERWQVFLYECFERGHLNLVPPSLEDIWHEHADAIVAEWAEARPGTRPRAWWQWSSPEAQPNTTIKRACVPPDAEQFAYLQRHDLLLPGEAAAASAPRADVDAARGM